MAAGVHQGFLAADPEQLSLASAPAPGTPTSATPPGEEAEDRLWGRSGSVVLEIGGEGDATPRSSGPSRLAASLKARLAVRRRPVVTWRPYPRPPAPAPPTEPLPEVLLEEVRAGLPEGAALPPGLFEDECAFMWRTIEEDGEPPPTPAVLWDIFPEGPAPPSPPCPARPPRTPRGPSQSPLRLEVPRPRILVRRPSFSRRRAPRPRRRCNTCSLPLLPPRPRPRPAPSRLPRTLSCPAVFARPAAPRGSVSFPAYLSSLSSQDSLPRPWPRMDSR